MTLSAPPRPAPTRTPGIERLTGVLSAAGGVCRVRTVVAAGVSVYEIERAAASGVVIRIRKGWIALPDADADLVSAARAGVVLTCVTAARRLGLWVPASSTDPPHVAAPPHSGAVRVTRARVHWGVPLVPRHPDTLVDPIENVLALAAVCVPREESLIVWESALNRGLVARESLARLPLSGAARRMLDAAAPWSDSGLETIVRVRLAWLRIPIVAQAWIHGRRVDFLLGDRLVLQVDGGHHVGRQRDADIAHDAQLLLRGYHVIRVSYVQVTERWHEVQDAVMRAVAQGAHLIRS